MQNWRNEFQNLNWSQGWTAQDLQNRFPSIPREFWSKIPSGQTFFSFDEFWRAAERAGAFAGLGGFMGGSTGGSMGGNR
jgi:hypothetical protein